MKNFAPIKVYKNINLLLEPRNLSITDDIIGDEELNNKLFMDNYFQINCEDNRGIKDNVIILIISPNSHFESGIKSSEKFKKLIERTIKQNPGNIDIILITKEQLKTVRVNTMKTLMNENVRIQNMQYYNILADPLNHTLSPNYEVIVGNEMDEIISYYKRPLEYYPKFLDEDPIRMFLDPPHHSIIKITRDTYRNTEITYKYYP